MLGQESGESVQQSSVTKSQKKPKSKLAVKRALFKEARALRARAIRNGTIEAVVEIICTGAPDIK